MTDYEKLNKLYTKIDELIEAKVTYSSPEFKAWHYSCICFLNNYFGKDSIELERFNNLQFQYISFDSTSINPIQTCKNDLLVIKTIFKDYLDDMEHDTQNVQLQIKQKNNKVFIVHGHDEIILLKVKSFLIEQGISPVILNEQINCGLSTIIDKIKKNSDVGAAIVLFTPDDVGRVKNNGKTKPDKLRDRARQNVIFEAGYFISHLGEKKVIFILGSDDIEMPSDLNGIVYNKENWQHKVISELREMDFEVDANKISL